MSHEGVHLLQWQSSPSPHKSEVLFSFSISVGLQHLPEQFDCRVILITVSVISDSFKVIQVKDSFSNNLLLKLFPREDTEVGLVEREIDSLSDPLYLLLRFIQTCLYVDDTDIVWKSLYAQIHQICTTGIQDMFSRYRKHVQQVYKTCVTGIEEM